MKFLKNPEIKRALLCFLIISALFITLAFLLDLRFGVLALVFSLLFCALYLFFTARRYKRIEELSLTLDRILHGEDRLSFDRAAEGELGILESQLYKTTVRLREQQRLLKEDKIYLANAIADISHQIRTPLTSINLLLALLEDKRLSPDQRSRLLAELNGLLSRIEWLITALLKMSKLDAGTALFKPEEIPLKDLIDSAISPLLIPIELKEQTLTIRAQGQIFCDPALTGEALSNVVKNCMEHTPAGGHLEITAQETPLFSQITVSDSGCGIAKEDLPHIFERFYKGKNSDDKSFGIGLALAKSILQEQNGTIKAENKKAGGALFTLRIYKGVI
ncbi:MAG: HAMP domain-containing histidine kinase [Clostridia bacterium]|nr:HAMP domain-containing histidine kinase [Clostridia bacterium]